MTAEFLVVHLKIRHRATGLTPPTVVRFLSLDVHAETIATAVVEPDKEVRSLGIIPNADHADLDLPVASEAVSEGVLRCEHALRSVGKASS